MNEWWKTKRATSVYKDEDTGMYVCRYHDTPVVKWNKNKIILNSGGFRTITTKLRMNQVSDIYNLGFDVYQMNFVWYLTYRVEESEEERNLRLLGSVNLGDGSSFNMPKTKTVPFEDGIQIKRVHE